MSSIMSLPKTAEDVWIQVEKVSDKISHFPLGPIPGALRVIIAKVQIITSVVFAFVMQVASAVAEPNQAKELDTASNEFCDLAVHGFVNWARGLFQQGAWIVSWIFLINHDKSTEKMAYPSQGGKPFFTSNC